MGLPLISEAKKDKEAGGGGMVPNLCGFFKEAKVAGLFVVPLKIFAFIDYILILQSLTDSILTISSGWRLISKTSEPPCCWREFLSQALTSGVIENSTRKDWLCEEEPGRDLYLALGIHLLVLIFYLHRCTVSLNLLHAFFPNVPISLRVKYIKSWIFHSLFFILIYWLAFLGSQDIPKLYSGRIFTDAFRLTFVIFCMHIHIEKIHRKEQDTLKIFVPKDV